MKQRKPFLARFLLVALTVAALILIIYLLFDIAKSRNTIEDSQKLSDLVPQPIENDSSTHTTNFEVLEDSLKDMGFLITQEYYFTLAEQYTKTKKILFFNAKSSFTYSYDGVVEAGVDFNKIEIKKNDDDMKIIIKVPDAEIHNIEIDPDSFQQYDVSNSIWVKIKLQDYNTSLSEFQEKAKETALDKDILNKADKNAQQIITNFVNNLIGSNNNYEIIFE